MSNRYLPTALRRALEKAVKDARIVAEEGARDSIRRLGVADGKAPNYLTDMEKELRRRLRAHARAMGDAFDRQANTQETKRLLEAAAYAHWHRMLFARFLAERGLLRHPEHDVAVSLEDCRELAEAEGVSDAWAVAERYSAAMLPAVFRTDDPALALDIDPVHTQKLNRLVTTLDAEVFQAEDSLGWTYQFWRAAEKDAINASGVKIGADELPAVTQLFTEPYMVRFLLHNTLGAWWAGKVLATDPTLAATATDEDALRAACALPGYNFDMLRFVRKGENGQWRPAAGTFAGWPTEASGITMLDPCCGSGHFLTEALAILAAIRRAEENLSSADAVAAVLRDNLHGLEIDGRCVQIAAFAVALTAWRIGSWQILPLPHIAWVGAPPPLPKGEFIALAEGEPELEYALAALYDLFAQARILGTLLEPAGGDLFESEKMREVERLLEPLLAKARRAEPEQIEGAIAARGMADAAALLHRKFILQSTNVPFLKRANQSKEIADYVEKRFPEARGDLATAMLKRMIGLCSKTGTISAVTPQNWLFLTSYTELRESILSNNEFNSIAGLGSGAFETIGGEVVNVALIGLTKKDPSQYSSFFSIDANDSAGPVLKTANLQNDPPNIVLQSQQMKNPDCRISLTQSSERRILADYAKAVQGITTGDNDRYRRFFWELPNKSDGWVFFQSTVADVCEYGGKDSILFWAENGEHIARRQGMFAWGKDGILVNQMGSLFATISDGSRFDMNASVIVPTAPENVPALWAFCSSDDYRKSIRTIDQSIKVTTATLAKVPFDLAKWKAVASEQFPHGLPSPHSDSPNQWLFHGHPARADKGSALHVAIARICGHRWPAEIDSTIRLSSESRDWIGKTATLPAGDDDGLLGVPAVAGKRALADRLRDYLSAAFGAEWSDALERRLVGEADEVLDKKIVRDSSLDAWLRERAFRQHCVLFGYRPFLWHIWDGLSDGFSIFVHYHRFDQAILRKLTYTMLGDWLARAKAEGNVLRLEKGRELQQKLEKILEGEKPHDIFVRWKSLAQQPLGWEPDLNDGVRLNIRPFIEAEVLRDMPRINWNKDRGRDVASAPWYEKFVDDKGNKGQRTNDHHTTLAEKKTARDTVTKRVKAK